MSVPEDCSNCYRGIYNKDLEDFFYVIVQNRSHNIHVIENLWCQKLKKKLCYHSILKLAANLQNQPMVDLVMRYIIEKVPRYYYSPPYIYNVLKNNDYNSNLKQLITKHTYIKK